jgi:hypothetical protein
MDMNDINLVLTSSDRKVPEKSNSNHHMLISASVHKTRDFRPTKFSGGYIPEPMLKFIFYQVSSTSYGRQRILSIHNLSSP